MAYKSGRGILIFFPQRKSPALENCIKFSKLHFVEFVMTNQTQSIVVGKILFIWVAKILVAPGYLLTKMSISPLLFELFQIYKLCFVDLINTN
jgi:hypothetical protein